MVLEHKFCVKKLKFLILCCSSKFNLIEETQLAPNEIHVLNETQCAPNETRCYTK